MPKVISFFNLLVSVCLRLGPLPMMKAKRFLVTSFNAAIADECSPAARGEKTQRATQADVGMNRMRRG